VLPAVLEPFAVKAFIAPGDRHACEDEGQEDGKLHGDSIEGAAASGDLVIRYGEWYERWGLQVLCVVMRRIDKVIASFRD
jgi:hypothetical protein